MIVLLLAIPIGAGLMLYILFGPDEPGSSSN
jgi:hypothetical protein